MGLLGPNASRLITRLRCHHEGRFWCKQDRPSSLVAPKAAGWFGAGASQVSSAILIAFASTNLMPSHFMAHQRLRRQVTQATAVAFLARTA